MKIEAWMETGEGHCTSQDRILAMNSLLAQGKLEAEVVNDAEGFLAVLDGVGGLSGGEYAASFVGTSLVMLSLEDCSGINLREQIMGLGRVLTEKRRGATTLSGLLFCEQRCFLFHVGNTRIYGLNGEYLIPLTEDQTAVVESGRLNDLEFRRKNGHIITGCLGGGSDHWGERLIVQDVSEHVKRYTRLLFTTDGIHEYVSVDELENAAKGSISLREIAKIAYENGSRDDRSLMLVRKE